MPSAKLTVFAALLSLASAHIGLYDASGIYTEKDGITWAGSKPDLDYTPAIPLGKENGENAPQPGAFWFHGADIQKARAAGGNNPSKGTRKSLPAGGSVTLELACNRKWTSLGDGNNPNGDACPDGDEIWKSRHVQPGNEVYLGCGLAIAYKDANEVSDLDQITASDMTVFSVVNDCVKKKDVTFQIPSDMPACPPGGCICSWFWQGEDSSDEMYMTGFFCDVEGGNANLKAGTPKPAKHCPNGGCVEGPKQPLIWANEDDTHEMNVQKVGNNKPGYIPEWGFNDGPQPVVDGTTSGGGSSTSPNKPTTTSNAAKTTQSTAPKPSVAPILVEDKKGGSRKTNSKSSNKSSGTTVSVQSDDCEWPGHCYGAPCSNHNDCSDPWFCGSEGTCTGGSSKFRRSVINRL